MRRACVIRVVFVLSLAAALQAAPQPPAAVSLGRDGALVYVTNEQGDRIPDFSHCGYAGANQPIPNAPVRVVVAPQAGDSTERIQRALDYVGSLPADAEGFRGAVLLLKGRHEVLGGLVMTNSGVVLRGQGMNSDGTVLVAARLDRRTLVRVVGKADRTTISGPYEITDDYVPVGATGFQVRDPGRFAPGQNVLIVRPSTKEWIQQLGMVNYGGSEGGVTWKPGSRDIRWDRKVVSVKGDRITLDAPITTALDKQLGGGTVAVYDWPGRLANVGVENVSLESAFDSSNPKDESHAWFAITMENAADAWVRQVTFKHFAGSAVAVYESCKSVTVQDCLSLAPVSEAGGYRRNTFFTMGQLTLFLRCYSEFGRHDFSLGHCAAGPNAFVQCDAHLPLADSGPIDSWASGALFDNVRIDGNALNLMHRGRQGQGAGWAAANSVLWQCNAAVARCFNPPTAQNWAFGTWAEFEGDGIWRSSNDFVSPDSLYAGQLRDRLGAEAAERLQLMPRPHEESSNPPLDKAQELAAASHAPAPRLLDYILAASERDPIPSEPGNAKRIEELPNSKPEIRNTKHALAITNGWLTMDGKLLIGRTASITWWRGSVRPDEAENFGINISRFVPGRNGPGFTDDLEAVADGMGSRGQVALDHHYGLWYDRRRDDHERVRRMDGDVWPPFYELPFARSGQGTAWDGLSQYDLTQFNPWYWSRLGQFADLCEQRGLVLFHQNYFQHNILEAGAHWADFPWRSANNINSTGFPEPPPYAGDKRIFQAELFYDVTHPVRRKLHEGYIRQCLNNFANNANVIQFTSAEFTGPLPFTQFWLDTIAGWERNQSAIRNPQSAITGPLIALSATKDVQDAILADAKRNAVVDLIDFRYWWRTGKGEFAPPGGKNLAPRQFERQWHGGRPTDENLADMAAEYQSKYPNKPLICDFDAAGWAWLCAGGSQPRLPQTTVTNLLVAIPRMKPVGELSGNGQWVLSEPDRQFLIYRSRANAEVGLNASVGSFRLHVVDLRTGRVTESKFAQIDGMLSLPDANLIWLTKE